LKDLVTDPAKLQKLFAAEARARNRQIAAAVLGTAIGYGIGYQLGVRRLPALDAPEVVEVLRDVKKWQLYESQIVTNAFVNLSRFTASLDKTDRDRCQKLLNILQPIIEDRLRAGRFSSADLTMIGRVSAHILPLHLELQRKRAAAWDRTARWAAYVLVGLLFSAILGLSFMAWRDRRSPKAQTTAE
jgi:hypothetical protein